MLLNQQTRMLSVSSRVPSPDKKRRAPFAATTWCLIAAVMVFVASVTTNAALGAQRVVPSNARENAADESIADNQYSRALDSQKRSAYARSEYASSAYAEESKSEQVAFDENSEIVRNGRCVQKTFRAPVDKEAALIGAFLLRLLPENLRAQTSSRYNEKDNTLTIYGPEKAIELSESLLQDFSEPLYQAFLSSGDFVSVAGVRNSDLGENASASERPVSEEKYYDPNQNDVVKVAYEANGAIVPERKSYAVAFGAGDERKNNSQNSDVSQSSYSAPTPVWGQSDEIKEAAANDDSILDVATYRCMPNVCDRVALLVQRQFASNPAIAFSFDNRLGTIVVHTNRGLQREVADYLASLQVYPDTRGANAPDLRVATGAITEIDGFDSEEPPLERQTRQAFAGSQTSMTADSLNEENQSGSLDDVYLPQNRKVDELQDALLQLFGDRLQRQGSNPNAPYSKRQIATYRFVKRQRPNDVDMRTCEVSIDSLHNRIVLEGDPVLCTQMLALLRAMDQPPLRNGNVRRFIPIRNGDSYKLRQIFEYDTQKSARSFRSFGTKYAVDQAVEQLLQDEHALQLFESGASIADQFEKYFSDATSVKDRNAVKQAGVVVRNNAVKALQSAYRSVSAIANADVYSQHTGVRQVAYQEDGGLGDVGPAIPVADDDFARNRANGVGVVQDFTPTVLQDIDVVIVDNATDAEFERIKQMIEQIEELAKIADVQTEIYNLEHVDCAMLHGVLTTLYTEMFTTKQGRVVFYALQNPNAILIAGWGQAFKDMKDLIELFDQPILDGSGTLRVVRLKYASADEIAGLLADAFIAPQTTGTGGFAPRIRAFADVRTNSLVVQASPNDWQQVQDLLMELDVNKADTKLVTRVFPLKNSLAENIRTTIMDSILPAKQGTLDTSAAKFPILELLSVDDSGKKLVESGVMMDVDVVADVYHNQLIVNAPEDCMEFMERLIELLDVAPKKAQIRFFRVIHGDASQIMKTLQSLLVTTDDPISTPTLPQADGEETFVPVRFAIDTRTNVIIAAAAPRELAIIEALVVALDSKDTAERVEEVVQLRNIQALVVAQAIDDYLSQKQTLETASEVLSNYQLYESQVIVIPESISNSIIVSASPSQMENIMDMIHKFDQDPPQVVIQVLIAEVTLSNTEEFGIEAGLQDSVSFDRSLITSTSGGTTGKPGFDIIGSSGPGQNMSSGGNNKNVAGQVLNNFGMGATSSSLGYGGFVVSGSSRSIDVTLRALREKNRLQVLSRPQVTAMDNQQAFILVGQRVPRINGTTTTNYGVQMNTTDTPVGLILLVTPRVTKDGKVVMEIGAEKSSLGNDADATPIYSQDGQVIKSQSINTIQAMTAISAKDGETVMLGGLLTSSKEKISRGVPYLSDVPLLGWLFRYDQEIVSRKELLIVMTPRIMHGSEDYAETMRKEVGKTNLDLDEAMQLNGNMGLYDPRTDNGLRTKKTRRLIDHALHPDKMDELENITNYTPANDYAPRPQVEETIETPVRRSIRKTPAPVDDMTVRPISSREQYSWNQSNRSSNARSKAALPAVENDEFILNDDDGGVLLLNDDFTSNDAPKRAEPEKVAMRQPDRRQPVVKTNETARRAPNDSFERNSTSAKKAVGSSSVNARSAREDEEGSSSVRTRQSKQSARQKSDVDELYDSRSARYGNAERYDAVNASIRGQEKQDFVPVSRMKENSGFRLFHWAIAK